MTPKAKQGFKTQQNFNWPSANLTPFRKNSKSTNPNLANIPRDEAKIQECPFKPKTIFTAQIVKICILWSQIWNNTFRSWCKNKTSPISITTIIKTTIIKSTPIQNKDSQTKAQTNLRLMIGFYRKMNKGQISAQSNKNFCNKKLKQSVALRTFSWLKNSSLKRRSVRWNSRNKRRFKTLIYLKETTVKFSLKYSLRKTWYSPMLPKLSKTKIKKFRKK